MEVVTLKLTPDLRGAIVLVVYYVIFVSAIAALSMLARKTGVGEHSSAVRAGSLLRELVRKSYHVMCSTSALILVLYFRSWYAALATVGGIFTVGLALIWLGGKMPSVLRLSIARESGTREIIKQALYVQATTTVLLVVFWGILGPKYKAYVAAGLLVWGLGDAAAAIVGKRLGRKRFRCRIFDRAKTHEGMGAMIVASFAVLVPVLVFLAGASITASLITAAVVAVAAGFIEASSQKGMDTLSIPLSVAALTSLLAPFLTGLGIP